MSGGTATVAEMTAGGEDAQALNQVLVQMSSIEQNVENTQEVETSDKCGGPESKESDKEESEHDGNAKVVRRVPPKYK